MNHARSPVLVFIRGMPGSGKSYLADALQKSFGESKVLLLDPDKIDLTSSEFKAFSKTLEAEGLDEKIHPFRWLRTTAYSGITTGKIIIWNQPFTVQDVFQRLILHLQDYAKQHQVDLPVLMVEVEINPSVAKSRVKDRKQAGGHGPSDATLDKRIADHKSYESDHFSLVTVKGDADIASSVDKVSQAIDQLRNN